MLKIASLFAAVLVAVSVLLAAENQFSHSFQTCINGESAQQRAEGAKDQSLGIAVVVRSQATCSLRLIDAHNGFFSAIGALAVACFTLTLWLATEELSKLTLRSVKVAEKALTDLERPYVFISRLDMSRRDQTTPGPHFRIGLKNHGRTPAIMQSIEFSAHMRRGFREEEPISAVINAKIFEVRAMSNVVGAQEDYTGTVIRSDKIDNDDIDVARGGLYQTQVLVTVTYGDIFDRTHTERFDYMWDRREKMFLRTEDVLAGDAADQKRIGEEKASQEAGNPPNWIR